MLVDYSHYLKHYCLFPIFVCCFCLAALLLEIFNVKQYVHNKDISINKIIGIFFRTVILIVCLVQAGIIPLSGGSLALLIEQEEDAAVICGTVEGIETINDTLYAQTKVYKLVINGTECIAIYVPVDGSSAKTPFKAGDYVEVMYLPQSGYILSIDEIDDP